MRRAGVQEFLFERIFMGPMVKHESKTTIYVTCYFVVQDDLLQVM